MVALAVHTASSVRRMSWRGWLVFAVLLMAASGAIAYPFITQGATYTWDGGGTTDNWSDCDNWSTNVCPSSSDSVIFDGTSSDNSIIDASFQGTVVGFYQAPTYTGTTTLARTFTVSSTTLAGGGLEFGSNTFTFNGASQIFTVNGTNIDEGTGTLTMSSQHATINVRTSETFYNLTVSMSNTYTLTIASGDTLRVTNTFSHTDGYINTGTIDIDGTVNIGSGADGGNAVVLFNDTGDETITCNASGVMSALTVSKASGTLDFSCATLTVGGAFTQTSGTTSIASNTLSLYANLTISGGIFDEGTGTVMLRGNGATVDVATSETFYNLTRDALTNGQTLTIASGDTLIVENEFRIVNGGLIGGTIDINGTAVFEAGADDAGTASATAVLFNDTGDETITCNNSGVAPSITVSKPSGTLDFSCTTFTTKTFTLTSGTYSLGSKTQHVYGGNVVISGGTFDEGTGAFNVTGWTANINVATSETFYNMTLSGWLNGGNLELTSGDTLVVTNTLTMDEGVVNGGTLEVQGNLVTNANHDGGTAAYKFSGSAVQTISLANVSALNSDITIDKSGGQVNLLNALTLDNNNQDLVIAEGTFDLNGFNLTQSGTNSTFVVQEGGNFQLQGSEITKHPTTQAGSTVTYDGTGTYTTLRAGSTYRNLVFAGSGTYSTSSALTLYGNFTQSAGTFTHTGTTTFASTSVITTTANSFFDDMLFGDAGISSTNLAGYWTLDTANINWTSNTTADSSGNGITGRLIGFSTSTSGVAGKVGQALDFNGSNTMIDVDRPAWVGTQWTWSAWVYKDTSGNQMIIENGRFSGFGAYMNVFSGQVYITVGGSQAADPSALPEDSWQMITAVQSGSNLYLYRNGNLVAHNPSATTPTAVSDDMYIGRSPTYGQAWDGYIDDVRVYSRALTELEVARMYELNSTGRTSPEMSMTLSGTGLNLSGNLALVGSTTLDTSATNCSSGSCPISLEGNWINSSATFVARTSTTTFDGMNQLITGSTTFHHFVKSATTADTLTFAASERQTVTGNLVLQGALNNRLSLRSTVEDTRWQIDPQSSRTIAYLDVQDSENTNATAIDAQGTGSISSGNNVNWIFAPPAVTTNAATNVVATSSILNANLTDTSGGTITTRGFATSTDANLATSVSTSSESGSFGTGTFSATSTELTGNTTYYFRAFVSGDVGTGYGSILSFLTAPSAPGTPTFSGVTPTTLRVEWAAPSGGAASYKVERCTGAACSDFAQIASGVATLYYDDSGLTASTVYRYRVRATNATGDSLYSSISDATTSADSSGTGRKIRLSGIRIQNVRLW